MFNGVKVMFVTQVVHVIDTDLFNVHAVYHTQVVQMINTDLLRQQQKWKDSLLEIRQIMTNLVQQVEEDNDCN